MNPYQALPQVIAPPSAGRPAAPSGGGLWSSILIFRLITAAETLVFGLRRAGRGR